MDNVKKTILQGLMDTIRNISDADFQKKSWVEGQQSSYNCFEETMHNFFDDSNAKNIILHYKEYEISFFQYRLLEKFYDLLNKYSDDKMSWFTSVDPIKILEDPEWHKIQKMAKKVLKAFEGKIKGIGKCGEQSSI